MRRIADLPVAPGGVAGGQEQLRLVLLEEIDDRLGGVGVAVFGFRLAALGLFGVLVVRALVEPEALVEQAQVDARAGGGAMDLQGLAGGGDPQGVARAVAGDDAPQDVGVGVVVQLPRKPMDFDDELAGPPLPAGRRRRHSGETASASGTSDSFTSAAYSITWGWYFSAYFLTSAFDDLLPMRDRHASVSRRRRHSRRAGRRRHGLAAVRAARPGCSAGGRERSAWRDYTGRVGNFQALVGRRACAPLVPPYVIAVSALTAGASAAAADPCTATMRPAQNANSVAIANSTAAAV